MAKKQKDENVKNPKLQSDDTHADGTHIGEVTTSEGSFNMGIDPSEQLEDREDALE